MRLFFALLILSTIAQANEYNRKDWQHWIDSDGDCQNTRHELLIEKSISNVSFTDRQDGKDCTVDNGMWNGHYLDKSFNKASDLDVDHVIPLKWAHDHGAAGWTKDEKKLFANDPLNLLLVDDAENQSKGARGPATWIPKNKGFHCEYASLWLRILNKYNLGAFPQDKKWIDRTAVNCGENKLTSKPKTKLKQNTNLSFTAQKQNDGRIIFSNVPADCIKNGFNICLPF